MNQLVDLTPAHRSKIKSSCPEGYSRLIRWFIIHKGLSIQGEPFDEVRVVLRGLDKASVQDFLATQGLKIRLVGVPSIGFDYAYEGIQKNITFPYKTYFEAELEAIINAFEYIGN